PCFSNAFAFVKIFLFANISMISRRSLAAVSVCFQTRFVFEPKAMQSYDHFLNCANFQAFFFENFFQRSAPSERRPGSFYHLRVQRYCYLPKWPNISQGKFKQIFTGFHTPLTPNHLHQKLFHAPKPPQKSNVRAEHRPTHYII
ncbi:MAG: hypothetical protein SOV34_01060, partial [Sodaliphilus sp.]|nr:hypothetical protein [Sodaliphilus sp.]